MIQNSKESDETDINSIVTIWQKLKFSNVHIIFMIGFLFFNIDIVLTVFGQYNTWLKLIELLNSHRGVDIFNYFPPFIKMWQYSIILVLLIIIAVKLDSLFKWKYIQKGGKKFFICMIAIIMISVLLFNIELLSYSIIHRVILPLTWTYFYLYVLEDILLQDAKKKKT